MKILSLSTNYSHWSLERSALVLIPLLLAWFALSQQARAICNEGCLTNNNTALGDDALISLTTGSGNTAIGDEALESTQPQATTRPLVKLHS